MLVLLLVTDVVAVVAVVFELLELLWVAVVGVGKRVVGVVACVEAKEQEVYCVADKPQYVPNNVPEINKFFAKMDL